MSLAWKPFLLYSSSYNAIEILYTFFFVEMRVYFRPPLLELRSLVASCDYFSIMLSSLGVATSSDTTQTAQVKSRVWEVRNVTMAAQASTRQDIAYRCPLGSGTRCYQVAKDTRGCGTLGNASLLWLCSGWGDITHVRKLQSFAELDASLDQKRDRRYDRW